MHSDLIEHDSFIRLHIVAECVGVFAGVVMAEMGEVGHELWTGDW